MSEHELGTLAYKLFRKREKLSEKQEQKNKLKLKLPEKPISYDEARKLQLEKIDHSHAIDNIEDQINEIKRTILLYEKSIKEIIPTDNTDIKVSANVEGETLNFIIKHVTWGGSDEIRLEKE